MNLDIGRTGLILLCTLFVLLVVEDVFVWITEGVLPGIGFFLASLLLVAVILYTVRAARRRPPPRS